MPGRSIAMCRSARRCTSPRKRQFEDKRGTPAGRAPRGVAAMVGGTKSAPRPEGAAAMNQTLERPTPAIVLVEPEAAPDVAPPPVAPAAPAPRVRTGTKVAWALLAAVVGYGWFA